MYVKSDIEQFDVSRKGMYIPKYEFMIVIKGVRYEFIGVAAQHLTVAYGKSYERPTVELIAVDAVVGSKADMVGTIIELALRAVNRLEEKHEAEPKLKYDIIKTELIELITTECQQYVNAINAADQYLQGLAMGKLCATTQIAKNTKILTEKEIKAITSLYGV